MMRNFSVIFRTATILLCFIVSQNEAFLWNSTKKHELDSLNFLNDKHAASARSKRNSYFFPSPSNGISFREKVYRNHDNDGRGTNDFVTMDPNLFHSKMKPSEAHGGLRYKVTRVIQLPKQGKITGIVREFPWSSGLTRVDQFLGIPYAEAPVGSRRFMPPSNPLSWNKDEIFEANKMGPVCPQKLPDLTDSSGYSKGRYEQIKRLLPHLMRESEDCLNLNLYVKNSGEYIVS